MIKAYFKSKKFNSHKPIEKVESSMFPIPKVDNYPQTKKLKVQILNIIQMQIN